MPESPRTARAYRLLLTADDRLPITAKKMPNLIQDFRYVLRLLRRSPGFTIFAVLTLGVGIGANVMVFSVLNAVLVRPLPVRQPEHLVRLYSEWEPAWPFASASAPDFVDWRERNTSFERLAATRVTTITLQTTNRPERVLSALVSANYFELIGVAPSLGRGFMVNEDQPGNSHVVILSEGLCLRLFGSIAQALGRTVQLNAESYTVVGVMPASFHLPEDRVQLWVPLEFSKAQRETRGNRWLNIYGRLKPGITIDQAGLEMSRIAANLAHEYPADNTGFGVRLVPLQEDIVGKQRPTLLLLQGAVACMLLIATINLANLLLSRMLNRRRELAIRASLGASRWRLIQQLLAESLLLGGAGGILGIALAFWGVELFMFSSTGLLPRFSEIQVDGGALCFTVLLSLSVGTICGLLPALGLSKSMQTTLREGSRGTAGGVRQAVVRNTLVVAEIGCALLVLSSAGLLLRSFLKLQETGSGIGQAERVLTASLSLPPSRYPDEQSVRSFYQRAQVKVSQIPGVKSAGAISLLPLTPGDTDTGFQIVGRPHFPIGQDPVAQLRVVSGNYFEAAGIPLIAGRFFDNRDGPDAAPVILINRSMALRFWKSAEEAIGHQIDNEEGWIATIVGVVGDVHHFGLAAPVRDEFYYSENEKPGFGTPGASMAQGMVLVLRATDPIDPQTFVAPLRQKIEEIDPVVPLSRTNTWSQLISDSISDRRLSLWFVGSFAVVALVLAAMGLYSVISYGVAQRTREIAVRAALGARRLDIFRLVLAEASLLIAIGIGAGLVAAFFVMRLMQGLVYGVGTADPQTFLGVILLLTLISLTANYLPARRAMNINPTLALREE
jgi:putative ABC transport system permease protein